jgi:endogenous inhibitor of DNA gyrase (YacG/DUF329 family)
MSAPARPILTLEIICANPACGKAAVLTGSARRHSIARGYGYCSTACGHASLRAQLVARMMDPVERARSGIKTLELSIECATCGKAVVLTGRARTNVLQRGGRGYCPNGVCGKVGASVQLSAVMTWRMADPVQTCSSSRST